MSKAMSAEHRQVCGVRPTTAAARRCRDCRCRWQLLFGVSGFGDSRTYGYEGAYVTTVYAARDAGEVARDLDQVASLGTSRRRCSRDNVGNSSEQEVDLLAQYVCSICDRCVYSVSSEITDDPSR